jgi:predicted acyl esterase
VVRHWIRGRQTPLLGEPRVRYFEVGGLIWRTCDEWPPPHRPIALYLHSGGRANSRFGDGHLSTRPPGFEPPDSYLYDPADPVPTVGGRT